jgi:hypothetical protein
MLRHTHCLASTTIGGSGLFGGTLQDVGGQTQANSEGCVWRRTLGQLLGHLADESKGGRYLAKDSSAWHKDHAASVRPGQTVIKRLLRKH